MLFTALLYSRFFFHCGADVEYPSAQGTVHKHNFPFYLFYWGHLLRTRQSEKTLGWQYCAGLCYFEPYSIILVL